MCVCVCARAIIHRQQETGKVLIHQGEAASPRQRYGAKSQISNQKEGCTENAGGTDTKGGRVRASHGERLERDEAVLRPVLNTLLGQLCVGTKGKLSEKIFT